MAAQGLPDSKPVTPFSLLGPYLGSLKRPHPLCGPGQTWSQTQSKLVGQRWEENLNTDLNNPRQELKDWPSFV